MRDLTYSHHRIIASTGKIEKVLQVGTVISVAVIIVKALADQGALQASGIATFLGKSWILFLAITVAHLSLATFLVFEIRSYLNSAPPWRDLRRVLDQIESRKNLLTHGLVSRAALTRSSGRVGRLQLGLWPTLAVYFATVSYAIALLPWHDSVHSAYRASDSVLWVTIILTAALIIINWLIGFIWLSNLLELDDLAAWIASLPDTSVSDGDMDRLMRLGAPILAGDARLQSRRYYEIANILNRLAADQAMTSGRSFSGLRFRLKIQTPLMDKNRLAVVTYLYLHLQAAVPWLIQAPSPWFISQKHSKVRVKGQPDQPKVPETIKIPRKGDDLYDAVQPFAEAVKGYLQICIGLAVAAALIYQWLKNQNNSLPEIADRALTLVGGGLAISAVVELAYTFFTQGPDEALDPLILGIASFALINISRHDPPLDVNHAVPVLLLTAGLVILFVARRFLLQGERKGHPGRAGKADPPAQPDQRQL